MIRGPANLVLLAGLVELALLPIRSGATEDGDRGQVGRPTHDVYHRLFDDRPAILDAAFVEYPAADRRVALLYAGGRLMAFDAVKNRLVWRRSIDPPAQPEFLGETDGRMLFLTPTYVFSVASSTGREQWRWGDSAKNDPGADPEWTPQWVDRLLTATCLILVDDRGRMNAIQLADGSLAWSRPDGPRKTGRLAMRKGRVAWLAPAEAGDDLSIVGLGDGEGLLKREIRDAATTQAMVWPNDGCLLLASAGRIVAVDPEKPAETWRIESRDRFWTHTLQTHADGLFVSGDGRRMTRYDLVDGRRKWTSPPLAGFDADGLWCRIRDGKPYTSSSRGMAAIDGTSGKALWKRPLRGWQLLQSPIVTAAGLVYVSRTTAGHFPRTQSASGPAGLEDRETWHHIDLAAFDGGKRGWTLRIEPIESFGGMSAGDDWVLLVDGRQLIGYVRRP